MMDMGGGGGGSGGGGGMGGLEQLLGMLGMGSKKGGEGGAQGGTSDHNAGKSNWEKMDALGNIADGNKDLRPAEHSEMGMQAPAPLQQQAAPMAQQAAPRAASPVPTNQQVNNMPPPGKSGHMGYNDAQGEALDDYAAEELRRRQASMDIA